MSEWEDTFAAARAAGDQHLAAIRELEEPIRTFMAACFECEQSLRSAGIPHKQRVTTMVTLALGAAITE